MTDEIPADVSQFITDHLNSVAELEVLLLIRSDPGRGWTAADISKVLCTPVEMVIEQMAGLQSRGLILVVPGPEPQYQYQPRTPELDQVVASLSEIYKARRVTVITLIYSKPVDRVRTFADAFRLRKDP
jgi:hypothetical protein